MTTSSGGRQYTTVALDMKGPRALADAGPWSYAMSFLVVLCVRSCLSYTFQYQYWMFQLL